MISRHMAKNACESLKRIDIRFLKQEKYLELGVWKNGMIVWSSRGVETGRINACVDAKNNFLNINYYYSDPWTDKTHINENISLTSTPCYFGGVRYWLRCACGRRIGVLYAGGAKFACRHCYNLAYYSQQEYIPTMFKALGKSWKDEKWLEKECVNMRVKFWKGRPTKRYKKWLERLMRYETISSEALKQMQTLTDCLGAVKKVK